MRIARLDHLVLTVKDIGKTIDFYTRLLGMELVTFKSGGVERKALKLNEQKLNLHEAGKVVDENVRHATPGSGDLCFLIEGDLAHVIDELKENKIDIISGPVDRTGANGPIKSVYFYDPDENLIELAQPLYQASQLEPREGGDLVGDSGHRLLGGRA